MNGVEILSVTEVVVDSASNWWLAGFVFLGIIIFGGIIGFVVEMDIGGVIVGCTFGVLIGFLGLFIAGAATDTPIAYETHYKVIIDDSVLMNDFLEKYEIVDQDGKIYTVREKD
jgi:hypothetical protein